MGCCNIGGKRSTGQNIQQTFTVNYAFGTQKFVLNPKTGYAELVKSNGEKVNTNKTFEQLKNEMVAQGASVEIDGKVYKREKRNDVTSQTYKTAQKRLKKNVDAWFGRR